MMLFNLCHMCVHDLLREESKRHLKKSMKRQPQEIVEDLYPMPEFRPLRIKFAYEWLFENYTDPYRCDKPYVKKQWACKLSGNCPPDELLNDEKRRTIIGTLENVKKFLEKHIQVRRNPKQKHYRIQPGYTQLRDHPAGTFDGGKYDVHVLLAARSYSFAVVANADATAFYMDTHSIQQGFINVNPRFAPKEIQDYNSEDNFIFLSYLHEMFHVLGESSSIWQFYRPMDSYKPYGEDKIICHFQHKMKNFTILHSPYAHAWAKKRYGVEWFVGDNESSRCPAGIELEDSKLYGLSGSHPEGRVYYTDLVSNKKFAVQWLRHSTSNF